MREPSPYAGKTVRLRADAYELGGHDLAVVDWYQLTSGGRSWRDNPADPRAGGYAVRRGVAGLPDDDEVLFGRVDGMGQLVHVAELDAVTAPTRGPLEPKPVDPRAVSQPCPACRVELAEGAMVAALPIGPGADPTAREAARAGRPYEAVVLEVHWACLTGDESYDTGREG